ncbi:MAG: SHOCT domain-containing protein [Acidimicrobiales bacterium]
MLAELGTGEVLWSIFWFFLFFIWIMILFRVFGDIFMSHDLSGFAKVLWCLFVIFLPYLGVFVYLIARGDHMTKHAIESAKAQDAASREYIQSVVSTSGGSADELAKLAALKADGTLSEAEFNAAKAKLLAP